MDGTVIDVQVFTRDGVEKDQRALQIEDEQMEHVRKDLNDQLRIMEDDIYQRVEKLLQGKVAEGGPAKLAAGAKVTRDYLAEIGRGKWFEIRLRNEDANTASRRRRPS